MHKSEYKYQLLSLRKNIEPLLTSSDHLGDHSLITSLQD